MREKKRERVMKRIAIEQGIDKIAHYVEMLIIDNAITNAAKKQCEIMRERNTHTRKNIKNWLR